ncbi:MAG: hypothetical protein IJ428_05190 [Clostridia bacterium]|nr:hypothetical protein [Clostridia bacterium]
MLDVTLGENKAAVMIYGSKYPFSVYMSDDSGKEEYKQVSSPFFMNLIRDMLRFFETGETSFDTSETKAVIKLVEMCIKAASQPGITVNA